MGVGMPAELKLHEFGSQVWSAFGEMPYHVGSSLKQKQWRDVDVRIMLSDEDWDKWGFGNPARTHTNARWVALCLAFSALGKEMTGLPIDFQIQKLSDANDRYDEIRSALGIIPLRRLEIETRDEHCHADSDGDCEWAKCPQLRDGEPKKTGRHCPLDNWSIDDE